MPKGFSEQERAIIQTSLLARTRELLAKYGMRKTSVEDLTSSVGISKGAFYLFYDSKEELFYEVIQKFEAEYHASLLRSLGAPATPPRERVRVFIEQAMSLWRTHPLFRHFSQDDYELLRRRLPPEKTAQGLRDDEAFARRLVAAWAADGVHLRVSPQVLAGMLRALFFVNLHTDDFSPEVYTQVISRMIELVANDITQ
ncbi:MAG: TetR/AcrR family transcriptional regulator [Oscillochloris sp.]|nr:TetR/AcrR family transcriptional regulator [Oscillochloris sp.]